VLAEWSILNHTLWGQAGRLKSISDQQFLVAAEVRPSAAQIKSKATQKHRQSSNEFSRR